MRIDTEKNQDFLRLIYTLQNNKSNAVLEPKRISKNIESRKVQRFYDSNKKEFFYYIENSYFAENKTKCDIKMQGRKPKKFGQDEILEMQKMSKSGISNIKIAKHFKCSETTIRNYLKTYAANT